MPGLEAIAEMASKLSSKQRETLISILKGFYLTKSNNRPEAIRAAIIAVIQTAEIQAKKRS